MRYQLSRGVPTIVKTVVFLFLMVLVSRCTPTLERYNSLANQGILPLSTDNAHLGANLFLAEELSKSAYLMNFMKQRGGPQAIEILTEGRREPTILMFYPLRKEVYIADRSVEKQSYQWVVRGPFAIERQDYRELQGLGIGFAGEPLFFIQGRSQRFGAQPIVDNDRALLPIVPTPRPTPTRKPQRSKPIVYSTPTPTPFAPMNSDQKAIQAAQGFAERAENGDLVHTVVKDGEKLEAIALWYTGSKAKVTDLEKRNSISKDAPLALGSRIVVPLAIVRQFKIMTTP